MLYTITRTEQQASKYDGVITVVHFKDDAGNTTKTYIDAKNRNYKKWKKALDLHDANFVVILSGLSFKTGTNLINADSNLTIADSRKASSFDILFERQ